MKVEIKTVTPKEAREILKHNPNNRTMRVDKVSAYARDMKNGKWDLTGQGISIGADGMLLDGQHRLSAIIEANTPVEMMVITDAPASFNYDCGITRTIADQFRITKGDKSSIYTNTLTLSVIKSIYELNKYGYVNKKPITSSELDEFIQANLEDFEYLRSILNKTGGGRTPRGLRKALIPAMFYMIYRLEPNITKSDLSHIFNVFFTGMTDEGKDFPIIAFRNKILTNMQSNTSLTNSELLERIQFAFYHWVKGDGSERNLRVTKSIYEVKNIL